MSEEIREAVLVGASAVEIKRKSVSLGMQTLRAAGPSQGARGDYYGRRGRPRHRFGLKRRVMYTSGRTRSEGAAPWQTSKNF